ncbi:lipoate--protein ligase [Desulfovibrio sp. OttesenSCG-928-C14]|nr:lipoate--protein ligase [Desulfovibrio sp. OttesenSCG-928-C14]
MKVLKMPGTDPYLNLATEDYILTNLTQGDYLLLWRNNNTIVVGLHQNTQEEINSVFVEERKVSVVRRRTGGGAVYHDLGNLNFSFITDAREAALITMERFTLPIVEALREMGLEAEASGRNDILVGGKKVSGNAQALLRGRILHHGTLLFNSDLSVLSQALKVKPEKFLSKSVKSVRGRVGNISEFLQEPMSVEEFGDRILACVSRNSQAEELVFSPEERAAIQDLRDSRYLTWEWNFGRSPKFNFHNIEKYDGGFLELFLDVREGVIDSCAFYGDFMALRPAAEVAEKLTGARYERGAVAAILAALPLGEYFGTLDLEDILDCMFNM